MPESKSANRIGSWALRGWEQSVHGTTQTEHATDRSVLKMSCDDRRVKSYAAGRFKGSKGFKGFKGSTQSGQVRFDEVIREHGLGGRKEQFSELVVRGMIEIGA